MKIEAYRNASSRGSALVITLVLGVIMLVIAVSYLSMIGTQQKLVVRSESWNASLTMAEAGVEEAMAQINASQTNFGANGWTASGGTFGPITRTLAGGSYSVLVISNASQLQPVIYSTGYVAVAVSGDMVSRAVRVGTKIQIFASVGLGAKNNIDFTGNGVAVNSFNSHMTNLSTGGLYDPNKTSTNGNVASVGGLVDIGNHTIQGNLYLGANATFSGSQANVTGTIYNDFNITFPDVTLPNLAWQTAPLNAGVHSITNSGNYTITDQNPIVIQAGVTATLNVTTSTDYSPSSIQIHGGTTNSGTAIIYMNGPPSMTMAGNTAVDASNRAENLQYFGLPSLTSITFSGTSTFVGVVYAPEASVTLNGGGNSNDFIGSLIANTITMHGHYNFHYDESLGTKTPGLFVATSWQEL
ncbi:MAG TPA: collagen-binding domain-containing protein [Candidatus Acidoferrales bacterium]|jgi:Tfp pilus assembly protein PilX|nr:collagen-binding domain-containing protein [Candidatus Acidoferrales bacterium]